MSWRNVTRRKARSGLTIAGIAIGVAAIVFLVSLMAGLEAQFESIAGRGGADLIVVQKESGDIMLTKLRQSIVQELAEVPGVKEASPTLFVLTRVGDYPYMIVCGLEVGSFSAEHYEIVQGRALAANDSGKMLLGMKAASYLKKGLHDRITIVKDVYEVVGIYETGIRFEDGGCVVLLSDAQGTFHLPSLISYVEVKVQDAARIDEVKGNIVRALDDVDAQVPEEVASKQEDLQLIKGVTSMVSFVAIVFGAIITMNTMIMSVYERTREIGILRAVGWKRRSILMMIMEETLLLALIGGAIGTATALLGVYALENLATIPMSVKFDLSSLLSGTLSVLLLGLLGGAYPAVRATRMDPVEALGHEV